MAGQAVGHFSRANPWLRCCANCLIFKERSGWRKKG
ncbi:hypothetical protein DFR38_10111 [Aquitalea magnusonii]|uniref:Uncharacterized protein n=1 Tax=Aquitalea magnusonii TaxID=332411 RepID=A0A318JR36_9NEIS|nr:hypothetical protein DFR38_10111 [Aquitalea magnusonii]